MNKKRDVWGWKSWLAFCVVCALTILLLINDNKNVESPKVYESHKVAPVPNTSYVCINPVYDKVSNYWLCAIDNIKVKQ